MCCSALPRLKPTLQPKRLLPFHFFTGLKFFLKSYEIGLLCSSLKKTSFPLQLQKCAHREQSLLMFFCAANLFLHEYLFLHLLNYDEKKRTNTISCFLRGPFAAAFSHTAGSKSCLDWFLIWTQIICWTSPPLLGEWVEDKTGNNINNQHLHIILVIGQNFYPILTLRRSFN